MLAGMKKRDAVKAAGGERPLAALLGITPQAVNLWRDVVPQLQVYRLRELKPRWFYRGGPLHSK